MRSPWFPRSSRPARATLPLPHAIGTRRSCGVHEEGVSSVPVKRVKFKVAGMTCAACERRVADALGAVPGVARAQVRLRGAVAELDYDEGRTDPDALKAAVETAGYSVPAGGADRSTIIALGIGGALAALYLAANAGGLFPRLPDAAGARGYGMLFLVGLLTSTHCVAMCGGFAISQGAGGLKTGLAYNGGRVLSYTLIGGIAGGLGAVFSPGPVMKGLVAGVAGLAMVVMALRMFGLRVFAANGAGRAGVPPRSWAPIRAVRKTLAGRGAFGVGLLNGLMPCGPLQGMQAFALGAGGFLSGALSMTAFSLGTVPLMLAFGAASAFVPKRLMPVLVKTGAVLVLFLGLMTLGRAAALSGMALPSLPAAIARDAQGAEVTQDAPAAPADLFPRAEPTVARVEGDVQTVLTDFGDRGLYLPIRVRAGIPVRWTIRVSAEGLNGCNNPLTIPAYGITRTLKPGDNLIEFTPRREGTIAYTCWMGMISSRIEVSGK